MDRVRRTRWALGALLGAGALLWGATILVAGLALMPARPWIPLAIATTTIGLLLWRDRFVWSLDRVALWLEEHAPEFRYAIVTLVDARHAASPARGALETAVAPLRTGPFLRAAAVRALLPPAGVLLALGVALVALPSGWRNLLRPDSASRSAGRPASPFENRLLHLSGTLTPPVYTGWEAVPLDDPETIAGLAGSQVRLAGSGSAHGITAALGPASLPVGGQDDRGWVVRFSLPDSAVALTLTDRRYRRLVVIDPRPDAPPVLKLRSPARDTTLRASGGKVAGTLRLEAELSDDVGLGRAFFEFIVASGESEGNFTFKSGTLAERRFAGRRAGRITIAVPYARFDLKEGDQLSLRAVALDGNTLSGPGKGYSETRTIRIARQSEYDSLAVTPAPPSADTALLSLRMLIIETEKLKRRRPTLARAPFVEASQTLAQQAENMRDKIKVLMDDQSAGGDFAVDPLLTTAYNAMWDGVRSLGVAEPGKALPPLREAYAALKKLQSARKYYVRGQAAPRIVNVARVRMTGTDTARAGRRAARPSADGPRDRFGERFSTAVELLPRHPTRATEALTAVRVDALRELPPLAAALGQALAALDEGKDATGALLAARRAIEGRPRVMDTLSAWSAAW